MIQLWVLEIRTLTRKPRAEEARVTIDFNKCDSLKVVTPTKIVKGLQPLKINKS